MAAWSGRGEGAPQSASAHNSCSSWTGPAPPSASAPLPDSDVPPVPRQAPPRPTLLRSGVATLQPLGLSVFLSWGLPHWDLNSARAVTSQSVQSSAGPQSQEQGSPRRGPTQLYWKAQRRVNTGCSTVVGTGAGGAGRRWANAGGWGAETGLRGTTTRRWGAFSELISGCSSSGRRDRRATQEMRPERRGGRGEDGEDKLQICLRGREDGTWE